MVRTSILVTGGTGFVGSHLLDHLLQVEPEAKIYALKRLNSSMRNVEQIQNKVEWLECDLLDYFSLQKAINSIEISQVYHLAACSWVAPSWYMPSIYMQTNAVGTINLLESILCSDVLQFPTILVSCTPEEYGNVTEKELPITENSVIAPVNHYAASKVAQDAICQSYFASYELPIIRTRAFNHEGPRRERHGALASFAHQIARIEAGRQDPIISVGNLSAKRNFTDVRDMVKAYELAMNCGTFGDLYLIGSDNIFTIKECLDHLIGLSKHKGITYKIDQERVRPTELNYLIGDCSKFTNLTGWKPTISFNKMLKDILNYWRKRVRSCKTL